MVADWFTQPNITNYTGMVTYANEVTGDVFGASIAWLVFIVAYVVFSTAGYAPSKAVMGSSYISWVLSMLMAFLGWVEPYIIVIFAVLMAVSTAINFKRREPWE